MGKEALPSIQYKTPEELAKALEETSQVTLARRVMDIAGEIKGSAANGMEELKRQLTGAEQKEIRKALPGTGIEVLLNEDMTPQERVIQNGINELENIVPGGKEVVEKVNFIGKLGKSISESWDVFLTLISEFKIGEAIGVLFAGFTGKFSLEAWNKKEEVGTDSDKKPRNGEKHSETETDFTTKLFVEYVYGKGKNKDMVANICQKIKFSNLKFSEIQQISDDDNKLKNWIKDLYGEISIDLEIVKEAFSLFSNGGKGKETLKNILKTEFREDLRFSQAISISNKDLGIFSHIRGLKPDEIFSGGFDRAVRFDKEMFSEGGDSKMYEERGISKKLGVFVLSNPKITSKTSFEELESLMVGKLEEDDRNKLREIIEFGRKIEKEIVNNEQLNLGLGKDISGFLEASPLNIIEILKIYIILGGETNFSTMNEFKQSFMYFSVGSILDNERGGLANYKEGQYVIKLVDILISGMTGKAGKIEIPEGVTKFMTSIGTGLIDHIEKEIVSLGFKITGGLNELIIKYPPLLGVLFAIFILYPIPVKKSILGIILPKLTGKR